MSCLYPPFLLCHADVITRKKARRGTRHGRIKTKCTNTRSQFVHSKITIFFANKRKEAKENAQTGKKKKFYYITNELLSDCNNEGMQSIHCIFMMIYAVYRLHLLTELCSVRTASLRKRCGLCRLFMLSLHLEQNKM